VDPKASVLPTTPQRLTIGNGIRQGGVLSPALFARYIIDLLHGISTLGIGCNVGGIYYNILAYADDLDLLASTWAALQLLLDRLLKHCIDLDMTCNFKKTVCMIFTPKRRDKIICVFFACIYNCWYLTAICITVQILRTCH